MTHNGSYTPHPLRSHTHCSQIQPVRETRHISPYLLNTFCTICPDAPLIPVGCELTCGFPHAVIGRNCRYAEDCPCAHADSPERAEALARWVVRDAERTMTVKAAVGE